MLKGRDIVIVGQQPWDIEMGSNCKNIAIEFQKYNRVLYVNCALKRKDLIKGKISKKIQYRIDVIKNKKPGIVKIDENFWNLYPDSFSESVYWLPHNFIFTSVNRINNKRLAKSISKAIELLGFKDIIIFNDNDVHDSFYLKELLSPKLYIYYSRDYILATNFWKKHGTNLEPRLIAKSDVVVCNSLYLTNYCKQYNKESYYIGQGCDFDLFSDIENIPEAADVKNLPKPVIGFVGALTTTRLDINILRKIALERPQWTLVLVGDEDEDFKKSDLHQIENIIFLGFKQIDELPVYINSFDVCLNPQILNQLTVGNYPRKIDEYLAMGKAVVATRTEAMEAFKEYVYLANSPEEYIDLIEKALVTDSKELAKERRSFALTHTWENSVKEIYKAISSKL